MTKITNTVLDDKIIMGDGHFSVLLVKTLDSVFEELENDLQKV